MKMSRKLKDKKFNYELNLIKGDSKTESGGLAGQYIYLTWPLSPWIYKSLLVVFKFKYCFISAYQQTYQVIKAEMKTENITKYNYKYNSITT